MIQDQNEPRWKYKHTLLGGQRREAISTVKEKQS